MTENLLQKLEEKMVTLLMEIESLRTDVQKLQRENASLKEEKESNSSKLQDLISLLDSISENDNQIYFDMDSAADKSAAGAGGMGAVVAFDRARTRSQRAAVFG